MSMTLHDSLRRSSVLSIASLVALCALGTCGGPTDLIVSIGDWPADAERLRVRVTLNDQKARDQYVDKGQTRFVVRLPDGSSGPVSLDIAALDKGDCKVAAGGLVHDVPSGLRHFSDDKVDLNPLMPRLCTVSVNVAHGKGGVTSAPAGIDCKDSGGACELDIPVGTAVDLAAMPGFRHYGGHWSGACTGSTACFLPMKSSAQVTIDFTARSCSADGWCWQNPLPTGNAIIATWGSSANDIWAVGQAGTILHWDGAAWNGTPMVGENVLQAIWGSGPADIWVAGTSGTLLHWDGKQWSKTLLGINHDFYGMWGSSHDNVWLAGKGGVLLHYNGTDWGTQDSGTQANLVGVWGTAADNIWIVGGNGTALHYDSSQVWNATTTNTMANLVSVGGSSANDAWAVGDGGVILHWNGSAWMPHNSNVTKNLHSVWASGANDVWASGEAGTMVHYNGSRWNTFDSGTTGYLLCMYGSNATDVWALGHYGTITHWDGIKWNSTGYPLQNLNAISGTSATDIWASGDKGAALHWNGSSWTPSNTGTTDAFTGIWSSSATDTWAVAYNVLHWNGSGWTQDNKIGGTRRIWGNGANDVWISGYKYDSMAMKSFPVILHWTGAGWNESPVPSGLYGLWGISGSGPKDVWTVGIFNGGTSYTPAVLQWSGSAWNKVSPPGDINPDVQSIWAGVPGQPWILDSSSSGNVYRYSGSGWDKFSVANVQLQAIWGSSSSDVWVAGASAMLQHWDGSKWRSNSTGLGYLPAVRGIWGTGPRDVWLVGDNGTILRYEPQP